jgi:hypothetical protein
MVKYYVIGPSHLCDKFLQQVSTRIDKGELFNSCELDAYIGLPNWSRQIDTKIREKMTTHQIVWLVSDYKFNNFDFHKILDLQEKGELFLNTIGHSGNVDIQFMHNDVTRVLGEHTQRVIDYLVSICPSIRLIFWCLYKRTRVNHSSYPRELWYDKMASKYNKNVIDIDRFTTTSEFQTMILDESGHPNEKGLELLSNMITGNQGF